jgi:hypothetical protein
MYSFRNIERRIDVDQIYLAPELFKQRRLTSFLSPQMSLFRKSSCMVGGQLPLGGLAGGESLALAASSTVSIFCIGMAAPATSTLRRRPYSMCLPSKTRLCPHLGERMRVGPRGRDQAWRRASGPGLMGVIETAKMDFRIMFGDLGLRVNYYYPPDGSFESGKREKPFA